MRRTHFLLMTAAIAVLMAGVAIFSACNKDDDNKESYVDLGLPSGTRWYSQNEGGQNLYTYDEAIAQFGDKLPTIEQLEELQIKCNWQWTGSGYKVTGPNGNSITLPTAGSCDCDGNKSAGYGSYWSSTLSPNNSVAYVLGFDSSKVRLGGSGRCYGRSVRFVQN